MRSEGTVHLDYGTFYLAGADRGAVDPAEFLVSRDQLRDGVRAGDALLAVFGPVPHGEARVRLEAHDAAPAPDLAAWDHVVEASIEVRGGRLMALSWDDALPPGDLGVSLPPGPHRVRILAGGFAAAVQAEEEDEGDDAGTYVIQAWPAPRSPVHVLRAWPGFASP